MSYLTIIVMAIISILLGGTERTPWADITTGDNLESQTVAQPALQPEAMLTPNQQKDVTILENQIEEDGEEEDPDSSACPIDPYLYIQIEQGRY